MIQVVAFEDTHALEWDEFVINQSANGTIFHTRRFLEYHQDRSFNDCSSLVYDSNKLVAVLAAEKQDNGGYFSHPGTSCGGPVIHRDYCQITRLMNVLHSLDLRYENKLGMRLCEDFLIEQSNAMLLYHYSRFCDVKIELSSYKKLNQRPIVDSIRSASSRSAVRKIFREGVHIQPAGTRQEYVGFHQILTKNLRKHGASPTHSEEEFLELSRLLGEDQILVICFNADGSIASGVWSLKASSECWHAQYIAKDQDCRYAGIVEANLVRTMETVLKNGAERYSLGISTEESGSKLNIGLSRFKEKLGCGFENRYILIPRQ